MELLAGQQKRPYQLLSNQWGETFHPTWNLSELDFNMPSFLRVLLIFLALIYIISPYDFVSDFVPVLGWIDDAFILGLLIYFLRRGRAKKSASSRQRWQSFSQEESGGQSQDEGAKKETRAETLWNPYTILGVKRSASVKEIQAAYRKLAELYHPDKVEHLGDELKVLANKKFVEIQRAYEELTG